MSMTVDQAQSAVSVSAVVVAGVYGYRKLVESDPKAAPTAHFVIGFGFVFITLALVAQAAPSLGGMLAILIAGGDLLTNGIALTNDLTGALKATAAN
jgi:hypothetical protein